MFSGTIPLGVVSGTVGCNRDRRISRRMAFLQNGPGGSGGLNRNEPTGGLAYGMPRYLHDGYSSNISSSIHLGFE